MQKDLDWIAVILISINIVLILSVLVFLMYGLEPGYTGSIGDTFGGLLSPAIGLISVYFIYKTFKAQREQLDDQIRATNFSGNSLYFNEANSMIADVKAKYNAICYGEYIDEKFGHEAIEAIKNDLLANELPSNFFEVGWPFLSELNEQVGRIVLIAAVGNSIKDENLKKLFDDKFKNELRTILKEIVSVFKNVKKSLKLMQSNDGYRAANTKHITWMVSQYESYLKSVIAINEKVSFVTKTRIVAKVHVNKITIDERLSKLDLTSDWSVM